MINKRIFGADIPVHIKKKLEARQLVAEGGKLPGDAIKSDYRDSRNTGGADGYGSYSYDELIRSDFEMEADLSSRTPFIRMWTAVSIVSKIDSDVSDAEKKSQGLTDAEVKQGYKVIDKKTYIINSNNLSAVHGLDPLESVTFTDYFQNELEVDNDSNKFLKQQAGITGLSSETGGTLGSIKTTTVSFKVNNFADFDSIYSKYFLKPGAQIFVDFGWNTISDLYDPDTLFDTSNGVYPKDKLYSTEEDPNVSADGIVAKEKGDLEVIVGIVTRYESKINEDGTVDCEVELTSKNSAMMMTPKIPTENVQRTAAKFNYEIEKILKYEAVYNLAGVNAQSNILKRFDTADAANDAKSFVEFEDAIAEMAFKSFGSKNHTPTTMALESGIFLVGDDATSTDQYLSWGFIEDNIFNKYFGHGDDGDSISSDKKGNFEVALDSSQAFTRFLPAMISRQSDDVESLKVAVPKYWDKSWQNTLETEGGKSGKTRKQRKQEFIDNQELSGEDFDEKIESLKKSWNEHLDNMVKKAEKLAKGHSLDDSDKYWQGDGGKYLITDYDKALNRIPLREVFVSTELLTKAFGDSNNDSMKKIINYMLDEINNDVYGVWDWALASDGDDNTLSIIDRNYLGIKSKNPKKDFDKLFTFNLMSKNSIVTSYDVSLSMPDGEIGSMYAIQAMSGTNKKMYPMSKEIERQAALASILNKVSDNTADNLRFRYLPDIQPYNAMIQNEDQLGNPFSSLYKDADGLITKPSTTQDEGQFAHLLDVTETFNSHIDVQDSKEADEDQIKAKKKRIRDMQDQRAKDKGKRVISTKKEKYQYLFTDQFNTGEESKPYPLPMELSLSTYGISSLQPGDIFKVDYLPKVYLDTVYFQIIKVSHKVDMSGWYTTLETQFRVRPDYTSNDLLLRNDETLTKTDDKNTDDNNTNNTSQKSDTDTNTHSKCMDRKTQKKEDEASSTLSITDYIEGELLPTINDSRAYRWNADAKGFSTWTDDYKKSTYHIPNKKQLGQKDQDDGWSYVYVDSFEMAKDRKKFGKGRDYRQAGTVDFKKGMKIYNVRNFEDLINYMDNENGDITDEFTNLVSEGGGQYIKKLLKFKVGANCKPGEAIYVHHPMYYWDDTLAQIENRYNGFGYSRVFSGNRDSKKPKLFGYTRAIYRYGEMVWWGCTDSGKDTGNTHWFTAPAGQGGDARGNAYDGLELNVVKRVYDISSNDSKWSSTYYDEDTMFPDKI